MIFTLVGCCAL